MTYLLPTFSDAEMSDPVSRPFTLVCRTHREDSPGVVFTDSVSDQGSIILATRASRLAIKSTTAQHFLRRVRGRDSRAISQTCVGVSNAAWSNSEAGTGGLGLARFGIRLPSR